MSDTLPIAKLAALAGRTAPQVAGYLEVGSFADEHATQPASETVTLLQAIEVMVASQLARMCADRQRALRITKRVMHQYERHTDTKPAFFAYDPLTDRSLFGDNSRQDTMDVAFRLTADAYPAPSQGWAGEPRSEVRSLGYVFLNLVEIVHVIVSTIDEGKEPRLARPD